MHIQEVHSPNFSYETYQKVVDSILVYIQDKEQPSELNNVLEALQQTVRSLFDDNEKMRIEIKQLKEKLDKSQYLEDDIIAGQIASKLEKRFVSIILKGTGIKPNFKTINHLLQVDPEKGLFQKSYGKENCEKIAQNLEKLVEEQEGLLNLFGIIDHFKTVRNSKAHPNLSLEVASKYVSESSFDESHKEELLHLIKVSKKFGVEQTGT